MASPGGTSAAEAQSGRTQTAALTPSLAATQTAGQTSAQTAGQATATAPIVSQQAASNLTPSLLGALGLAPLITRLQTLQASGEGSSLPALLLHQQLLERILLASFEVDGVLGRIDTEAAYASEDRYVLQVRGQRQANALNLVTFAASGALGAAGSAMQLTHGLNHAGTALQAASGGTSLVLSAVQFKAGGGKQPVRSPYNMLAEILDGTPNPESHYGALIVAYLHAPRPEGRPPVADGLTAAWRRLHRLQTGGKGDGITLAAASADRSSTLKLSADDLADREAMLHDLRANITLLRTDLQQVLLSTSTADVP